MNIVSYIKGTYCYKKTASQWHKKAVEKNPEKEIDRVYYMTFGKHPNINHPRNIIEKTYWLTLHTDLSMWTKCADKYLMRDYIKECGYEHFLPKLYGVWDNAKKIDFDLLPNKFVLKTNNASATVLVVKDKENLNKKKAIKILNQWLSIPFGYSGYQPHYLGIPPRIIAEEFLEADDFQKKVSPNSLIDYKFYCCEGIPQMIWVPFDRNPHTFMNMFDLNWNSHPEWLVDTSDNTKSSVIIPQPACLEEMIQAAKVFSKPFPEVRVDFYVIGNRPYIGELTFTPGYGFFTEEIYNKLGDLVDLTKVQKIK